MVVVAGCGYAYAKSLNTAKKKDVMRREMLSGLSGEEREMEEERLRRREAQSGGNAGPHGKQLSPLQSLVNQFSRQHPDA